jgi:hypothetical protein
MNLWLLPSPSQIKALDLPGFETLCQRADTLAAIEPGLDAALRDAFGWSANPPWAALLATGATDADRAWLLADLIHLQPEVSSVRVMALAVDSDPEHPDLTTLIDALRPWLADESIEIAAVQGGRLLLRCPQSLGDPAAAAPDALLGSDLRGLLPADLRWQRRINELQIVLTQQSCNEARLARQLPPWNCLWFWGHGVNAAVPPPAVTRLASRDPLLLAMARHVGMLPVDMEAESAEPTLRDVRDPRQLQRLWQAGIRPGQALWRCADGSGWRLLPSPWWKFWR